MAQLRKSRALLAWHFLPENGLTANGENVKVVPGLIQRMPPPVTLCERGYHWSVRALDALQYAPGPIVQRVRVWGNVARDTDKGVSSVRECLWVADAERTLHEFAIWVAEQAIENNRKVGINPHADSLKALQVKRRWLDGLATDGELDAARAAAWAAAWAAYNEKLEMMLAKLEYAPNPMRAAALLEVCRG